MKILDLSEGREFELPELIGTSFRIQGWNVVSKATNIQAKVDPDPVIVVSASRSKVNSHLYGQELFTVTAKQFRRIYEVDPDTPIDARNRYRLKLIPVLPPQFHRM